MILAAATVAIIEGQFRRAAVWFLVGAVFSWPGLIHGWAWTPADTVLSLGPGVGQDIALGYLAAALVLGVAPWLGSRDVNNTHS